MIKFRLKNLLIFGESREIILRDFKTSQIASKLSIFLAIHGIFFITEKFPASFPRYFQWFLLGNSILKSNIRARLGHQRAAGVVVRAAEAVGGSDLAIVIIGSASLPVTHFNVGVPLRIVGCLIEHLICKQVGTPAPVVLGTGTAIG